MDFPQYSPDLNPIEHLWHALKQMIYKLHPEIEQMGKSEAALDAFIQAAEDAWHALPQELMQQLVDSMERRIRAVIKAKGWQTKY
jgi:hypothetical protein